ncbi:MAG: hypothetical protein KC431_31420, partial [Myxococcales bacterium]|nr:hypothetical protein [Myxococcales bacterium]
MSRLSRAGVAQQHQATALQLPRSHEGIGQRQLFPTQVGVLGLSPLGDLCAVIDISRMAAAIDDCVQLNVQIVEGQRQPGLGLETDQRHRRVL